MIGQHTGVGGEDEESLEDRLKVYEANQQRYKAKIRALTHGGDWWELYCDLCGDTQGGYAGEFKQCHVFILCERCVTEVTEDS